MRRLALAGAVAALTLSIAPAAAAQSPVEIGAPPPTEFMLENLDGETVRLADVLGQRPVLLLFFRGTW